MNPIERDILVPERLELIRSVAEFDGLDDAALLPLAKALQLESAPPPPSSPWELVREVLSTRERQDTHWITAPDAPIDSRPLSIIVDGQVRLEQTDNGKRSARTLGRATLFNEEGVAHRAGLLLPPGYRIGAAPVGRAWLLRLPIEDNDAVLGSDPARSPLLERVVRGFRSALRAPQAVEVLKRDSILAKVRLDDLYALTEGAPLVEIGRGEDLPGHVPGAIPDAFYLVISGGFVSISPNAEGDPLKFGKRLDANFPIAFEQTIAGKPFDDRLVAAAPTVVMRIGADRFQNLMFTSMDFARAISDRTEVAPELRRKAHRQDVVLMLTKPDFAFPIGPLTDLVAEAIATHMYDRTCVLHVLPSGDGPTPPDEVFDGGHTEPDDESTTPISHRSVRAGGEDLLEPISQAVTNLLNERSGANDEAHDVILIDVSALAGSIDQSVLLKRITKIEHVTRIAYCIDDPSDTIPFSVLLRRVDITPIAFLGPFKDRHPVGRLMEELVTHVKGESAFTTATHTVSRLGQFAKTRLERRAEDTKGMATRALSPWRAGEPLTESMAPWPPRSTRVRLPNELRTEPDPSRGRLRLANFESARPTLERWARGITGRRIGVALGGGGAYGYVHVPLLEWLHEANIPVDLVSGSSFGAVIGAYYAGGDTNFQRLRDHWWFMTAATSIGVITTAGMTAAIDADVGRYDMNDVEVSYFPVVTDADTGSERSLRQGTLGRGVRASGSLPPMAPTIDGVRRFLDGGLVANVPVQVLDDEGAGLIIASNPIPDPEPRRPRAPLPIPVLGPLMRSSDPIDRIMDGVRSTLMLMRAASSSQDRFASVVYEAETKGTTMFEFSRRLEIIASTERDPEGRLYDVVTGALLKWRASLRRPPARVRLLESGEIRIPLGIGFKSDGERQVLTERAPDVLGEIADFLRETAKITKVGVQITLQRKDDESATGMRMAKSDADATERADQVINELVARGIERSRLVYRPPIERNADEKREVHFFAEEVLDNVPLQALEARLANAEKAGRRKKLLFEAKAQLRDGDIETARLLALEASRLGIDADIDDVLREILHQPLRCIDALETFPCNVMFLSWSPSGRWLARSGDTDETWVHDMTQLDSSKAFVEVPGNGDSSRGVSWFDDDERFALTGFSQSERVRRMDDASGTPRLIADRRVGTWDVWGVQVLPDQERILGSSKNGGAIWNPTTNEVVELDHGRELWWADISTDGERIVTCSKNGKIGYWNAGTGELIKWLHETVLPTYSVGFSTRGRAIIAGVGKTGLLWTDPDSDAPPIELHGHHRAIFRVTWSPSGETIATAGQEVAIRLWSGASGALTNVLWGHTGPAMALDWHPTLERLATGSTDGTARVWDAATGRSLVTIGCDSGVRAVKWSPDGDGLATAMSDGTTKVWDTDAHAVTFHPYNGEPPGLVAWRPGDPETILASTRDGLIDWWSAQDGETKEVIRPSDGLWIEAQWRPDGGAVAFGRGESLHVYDVATKKTRSFEIGDGRVERLRWRPDGKVIALSGRHVTTLFDVDAGKIIDSEDFGVDVVALEWSPNGRFLAIGLYRGWAQGQLWDTETIDAKPTPLKGFAGSTDDLVWVADWSKDGTLLAMGTNAGATVIWRFEDGLPTFVRRTKQEHRIYAVQWSPDGKRLLTGGSDTKVRLITPNDAPPIVLEGHAAEVTCAVWSHDGHRFATGSNDNDVRIWSVDTPRTTSLLRSHEARVVGLEFSADDSRLLTFANDGIVMIHIVSTVQLRDAVGEQTTKTMLTEEQWNRWMSGAGERRPSWPIPDGTVRPKTVSRPIGLIPAKKNSEDRAST